MLIPAFKLFGEEIPQTAEELDRFAWLTKNTTVDLSDFSTLLTRMAPYMDDLDLSMNDAVATLAALSDRGIEGTAATLALRTAITQAAREGTSLNDVLGLTEAEIGRYREEMEGATGITQEYADVANTQYGIMDKLRQRFSELTLRVGSLLTPMEPLLGVMTALGPILIILPSAIGGVSAAMGALGTAMHVAMGPVGLIILAVAGLTAAGILLWKNWDKVVVFFRDAWERMKIIFAQAVKMIVNTVLLPFVEFYSKIIGTIGMGVGRLVGLFNKDLGQAIEATSRRIMNARREISDWADNLIDSATIAKDAEAAQKSMRDMAEGMTEALRVQSQEEQKLKLASLEESRGIAQQEYDARIAAIREYYGDLEAADETSAESQIETAQRVTEERKRQYDLDIAAAREAYDAKIALIDAEYAANLKNVDAATAAIIAPMQSAIEEIDAVTRAEDNAQRERERNAKLAQLEQATLERGTLEERTKAYKAYVDYRAQIERERLLESRNAEKDRLRTIIAETMAAASEERDRLAEEMQAQKQHEQNMYATLVERLETAKAALDTALEEELARIDTARIAAESAEADKLKATTDHLDDERIALEKHYARELSATRLHVAAMNRARQVSIDSTPILPHMPGYQHGVRNFKGGLAMVGEAGPELVRLPRGADVIPGSTSQAFPVSIGEVNITVTDSGSPVATARAVRNLLVQIGRDAAIQEQVRSS